MHASPGHSSRPNNVGWVLRTELRALRLERPRCAASASWRLLTRCTCPAPPLAPLPRRPAVTASQVPGGGGALALYLLPRCLLVNTLEVPIQYKQQVGRIGTRGQSRSVRLGRPAGGGADHLHPPRHSRYPPIPAPPPACANPAGHAARAGAGGGRLARAALGRRAAPAAPVRAGAGGGLALERRLPAGHPGGPVHQDQVRRLPRTTVGIRFAFEEGVHVSAPRRRARTRAWEAAPRPARTHSQAPRPSAGPRRNPAH